MVGAPGFEISRFVAGAMDEHRAVVALESAFLTHGLPFPDGLETMLAMREVVSSEGAVPAAIGVIDGVPRIGLKPAQIERLAAAGDEATKIGLRELGLTVPKSGDGGATVSATVYLASRTGIPVVCTGGIGGVHRGYSWDVSADLLALARFPALVVCSGVKSILDVGATLEMLETLSVPVIGYMTRQIPGFLVRDSGFEASTVVDGAEAAGSTWQAREALELYGGALICVPVPSEDAVPVEILEAAVEDALSEAKGAGIKGQRLTPFLLERLDELTDGATRRANVALLKNNARVAAQIAVALVARQGQ
ncbi:MAG: pseudouridine-5'-phosphate glycosidase [Anaerolineae bacterium]